MGPKRCNLQDYINHFGYTIIDLAIPHKDHVYLLFCCLVFRAFSFIKYIHNDPTIALVLLKPRTCYNSL